MGRGVMWASLGAAWERGGGVPPAAPAHREYRGTGHYPHHHHQLLQQSAPAWGMLPMVTQLGAWQGPQQAQPELDPNMAAAIGWTPT